MVQDIKRALLTQPFQPFQIVASSGHKYRVPTSEHAAVSPTGNRVVVWFDDESSVNLAGLHIAAIEFETKRSA